MVAKEKIGELLDRVANDTTHKERDDHIQCVVEWLKGNGPIEKAELVWIPVSERLPEEGQECLVLVEHETPYVNIDTWDVLREAPVTFSSETIEVGVGWRDHDFEEISHWMPMPELPITKQRKSAIQMKDLMSCPACEEEMESREENGTHVWVCPECPIVVFECYGEKNLLDLKDVLIEKEMIYVMSTSPFEAIQWFSSNLKEVISFTGLHPSAVKWTWDEYKEVVKKDGLKIFTPEGSIIADIGDFIIKDINGNLRVVNERKITSLIGEPIKDVKTVTSTDMNCVEPTYTEKEIRKALKEWRDNGSLSYSNFLYILRKNKEGK